MSNVKHLTTLQMKQETINEQWGGSSPRIIPMSKMELAMLYAPNLTPQGAVNRLID